VYRSVARVQAPLVIVAHGFARHRRNMSGPAFGQGGDCGRGARSAFHVRPRPQRPFPIGAMREYLLGDEAWRKHIDPARVGLVGFSAGGLARLSIGRASTIASDSGQTLLPTDQIQYRLRLERRTKVPTFRCHSGPLSWFSIPHLYVVSSFWDLLD